MKYVKRAKVFALACWVLMAGILEAQPSIISNTLSNLVPTGAPVLSILTNPQSMGTGYVGVVASELNMQNGLDQNPALLASRNKVVGFQLLNYVSHAPESTINTRLLESGLYATRGKHAFGFSSRYIRLPLLSVVDPLGMPIGGIIPYEFMMGLRYAIQLTDRLALGAGVNWIHSDRLNGISALQGTPVGAADRLAGDFGLSYRRILRQREGFKLQWNAGLSVLNIGSKIGYTDNSDAELFLPQNLQMGSLFTFKWSTADSGYFAFDLSYQAAKSLVPTSPIYTIINNQLVIVEGLDPNVSSLRGAIQSFYDAPGGLSEELTEIIHQFGTEARWSPANSELLLALRGGYFNEHAAKGNRKFITAGLGIGYKGFRFDFARIFPTNDISPLKGTMFFGIGGRLCLNEGRRFRFIE